MAYRFPLLLVLLLPLALFGQTARVVTHVVTDTVPAWKVWKADGLSMNYPGQWTLSEPVQGDTLVIFQREAAGKAGKTVKVFVRSTATADTGTPGKPGRYEYEDDGTPMRAMERQVSGAGRPFMLTYSAPQAVYEEYLYVAEAMINSFAASTGR